MEKAATAVKNKDKKKPSEEKAAQTSGTKTEEKKESDGKDQKSDDSKKEDNKSSDSSKSDSKGDSSQSKQNSDNSQSSSSNNSSSNGGSQKKWVAEQGHWETDYSQVWMPNVVYTRHPRYWVNHGGTMVGPFDSEDAAFFRRLVWEQTIGKQSNERPFQKNPAVQDASGKTVRKSVRSSINLLQPSPGVRCAVMQKLGIPRIRITAPLSLQRISNTQHPSR